MRAITTQVACTLGLMCGAVGVARADYLYSFMMPDTGALTFSMASFIPAGLSGLNEALNTYGGSGQLAFTQDTVYGFQNVALFYPSGTTGQTYVGFTVDLTPTELPQATGQFDVSTYTLEVFTGSGFVKTEVNGGTLSISDFDPPPGPLNPVPEPSTYALMALGLGALVANRRRARRA